MSGTTRPATFPLIHMSDRIQTLKDRVEAILRDYPEARDYDPVLFMHYWIRHQRDLFDAQGRIHYHRMPELENTENLSRLRRVVQGDESRPLLERYLPTDQRVAERRFIGEEVWQQYCAAIAEQQRGQLTMV